MKIVIAVFLLAGSVFGQDGPRINRHKFYDTTPQEDFQKINRRRLTIDVDSTGIAMYAWGDECYFKINLLDRMLINADFYEQGERNGRPYIKYGNSRYRFRMYVNQGGNFEFDAIIRSNPNNRWRIPFNIETQGLRFSYQDTLSDIEKADGAIRPDSVVGSYAVYHASQKGNFNRADGTVDNYGTGKAFHIFRPLVWNSIGDTVYGFIEINEARTRMAIGVDSTWIAEQDSAAYPIFIDPTFGITSIGGTNIELGIYAIGFNSAFQLYTASTGDVVTTMHVYTNVTNQNDRSMSLYDTATSNGTPNNQMFTPVAITSGSQGWHTGAVSWALANNQEYTIVCGGAGTHSYVYDANASNILSRDNTEDPLQDPFVQSSTRTYEVSMYATFTEAGAGTPFINLLHGAIGAGERHGPSDTTRIHGSE